mmetsp:Transcript_15228/g.38718  ORF Transcript_15228/g.38718 Transcript_15228/m.38718 type:complete len:395 (+) Transcript_15228:433-1617(+)
MDLPVLEISGMCVAVAVVHHAAAVAFAHGELALVLHDGPGPEQQHAAAVELAALEQACVLVALLVRQRALALELIKFPRAFITVVWRFKHTMAVAIVHHPFASVHHTPSVVHDTLARPHAVAEGAFVHLARGVPEHTLPVELAVHKVALVLQSHGGQIFAMAVRNTVEPLAHVHIARRKCHRPIAALAAAAPLAFVLVAARRGQRALALHHVVCKVAHVHLPTCEQQLPVPVFLGSTPLALVLVAMENPASGAVHLSPQPIALVHTAVLGDVRAHALVLCEVERFVLHERVHGASDVRHPLTHLLLRLEHGSVALQGALQIKAAYVLRLLVPLHVRLNLIVTQRPQPHQRERPLVAFGLQVVFVLGLAFAEVHNDVVEHPQTQARFGELQAGIG